jgi:hypothetical protein
VGGPIAGLPQREPAIGGGDPGDAALRSDIAASGGTIVPGPIPTIVLPSTTSVGTPATDPANSAAAPVTPLPPVEDNTRYHAIQKGDTLYKLAERSYGSGSQWKGDQAERLQARGDSGGACQDAHGAERRDPGRDLAEDSGHVAPLA